MNCAFIPKLSKLGGSLTKKCERDSRRNSPNASRGLKWPQQGYPVTSITCTKKLNSTGHRLVYETLETENAVYVLAVGLRDDFRVYQAA
jgi:mRNA-degrading endonuclease RelE of RelBE toxin-antitoxin system